MTKQVQQTAQLIREATHVVAFTGAGVSVESGIPPFRGTNGLWNKYDPVFLDITYFTAHPLESWRLIREIFYDFFGEASPNDAHRGLAALEKTGHLAAVITQNIDNLHQESGSTAVHELHGTSRDLICASCRQRHIASQFDLSNLPPHCPQCDGVLRPDFVFFGEPMPELAMLESLHEAERADLFLIIGTTGEIMPASQIPFVANANGAKIVEINVAPSTYTRQITDIFLQEKATVAVRNLAAAVLCT